MNRNSDQPQQPTPDPGPSANRPRLSDPLPPDDLATADGDVRSASSASSSAASQPGGQTAADSPATVGDGTIVGDWLTVAEEPAQGGVEAADTPATVGEGTIVGDWLTVDDAPAAGSGISGSRAAETILDSPQPSAPASPEVTHESGVDPLATLPPEQLTVWDEVGIAASVAIGPAHGASAATHLESRQPTAAEGISEFQPTMSGIAPATVGDGLPTPHADDSLELRQVTVGGPAATVQEQVPTKIADFQREGKLGRYEIEKKMGEGAFGQVLKCRDPFLDRIVALKVAKSSGPARRSDVDRFLREAKSAARLRHPNIIPVFEYGTEEGVNYISYAFIDGVTLAEWLERRASGPLPERVGVIAQLAEALDYAHQAGVVHRDIKPENILVDAQQCPHIADFGCARLEAGDVTQTMEGWVLGTPAYMSPEQAQGKSKGIDGRADLWSLGVILYEVLCGQRPFKASQLPKLLEQIVKRDPPRPSQVRRGVPRDLETICLKCLAKEPDKRFARGNELAADLRRWVRGEPIQSRRVPLWVRGWMWARRNKTVASFATLFVVALLVGTIVASVLAWNLQQRQNELIQQQIRSLLMADSLSVPLILDNLRTLRGDAGTRLAQLRSDPELDRRQRLRVQLAALQLQPAAANPSAATTPTTGLPELQQDLLESDPLELSVLVPELPQDTAPLVRGLWERMQRGSLPPTQRLGGAGILALLDPHAAAWESIDAEVIGQLLREPRDQLGAWVTVLAGRGPAWKPKLETIYRDATQEETKIQAAALLGHLFASDPEYLVQLAIAGSPVQLRILAPFLQTASDQITTISAAAPAETSAELPRNTAAAANAALLAGCLDRPTPLQRIWSERVDPTVRTESIRRAAEAGLPPQIAIASLEHPDGFVVSASLLALGDYSERQLYFTERDALLPRVESLFREHPDAGVHAAAAWLLRRWGATARWEAARAEAVTEEPRPGFGWHEDPQGICFAVFAPIAEFAMGDANLPAGQGGEFAPRPHRVAIPRRFGVAMAECSIALFRRYEAAQMATLERARQRLDPEKDTDRLEEIDKRIKAVERTILNRQLSSDETLPVTNVTWMEAAAFCNWLSRLQKIPEDQLCYPRVESIKLTEVPRSSFQDFLVNFGYRLPTAAEWEWACRAGSATRYFVGQIASPLAEFDWTIENSSEKLHSTGQLRPSPFGMTDLYGNAEEWCHDVAIPRAGDQTEMVIDGQQTIAETAVLRNIRGGSYLFELGRVASYLREQDAPTNGYKWRGFRLARTYPPAPTSSASGN